jgi:hypothetical protein
MAFSFWMALPWGGSLPGRSFASRWLFRFGMGLGFWVAQRFGAAIIS